MVCCFYMGGNKIVSKCYYFISELWVTKEKPFWSGNFIVGLILALLLGLLICLPAFIFGTWPYSWFLNVWVLVFTPVYFLLLRQKYTYNVLKQVAMCYLVFVLASAFSLFVYDFSFKLTGALLPIFILLRLFYILSPLLFFLTLTWCIQHLNSNIHISFFKKMLIFIPIIVVVYILYTLLVFGQDQSRHYREGWLNTHYRSFSDKELGYTFQYPLSWRPFKKQYSNDLTNSDLSLTRGKIAGNFLYDIEAVEKGIQYYKLESFEGFNFNTIFVFFEKPNKALQAGLFKKSVVDGARVLVAESLQGCGGRYNVESEMIYYYVPAREGEQTDYVVAIEKEHCPSWGDEYSLARRDLGFKQILSTLKFKD